LAQATGAVIQANTPVTQVSCKSDRVEVRTELETYSAGKLVITVGSWTRSLLATLGLNLPLSIMPCQLAFFKADKPEDYELGKLPVFMAHMNGSYGEIPYGIPSINGSGVKISTFYGWQTVNHPKQVDYNPKDEWVKHLRTFIRSSIPGANGSLVSSRICLYTMTPDKHFIIDQHPEHQHVVFGAGFSGHGFKFSTLIGQILADLALSGSTPHDISLFRVSRFSEKTTQKATG
jgi:sarcosine oxidase